MPCGVTRLLLQQVRAVQEHDPAESRGALARVDVSAVPIAHERRKIPGVIEMSMGENDCVDRARWNRERSTVALAQHLEALEQTAIDQNP